MFVIIIELIVSYFFPTNNAKDMESLISKTEAYLKEVW